MTTAAAAPPEVATPPTEGRTADAVTALGSALETLSSRVSRREVELARLFDQIVVERNALLETVLNRLWDGFTGVIPFDVLECAFLSDDGGQIASYWRRSTNPAPHRSWAASLEGSVFDRTLGGRVPVVIDDLFARPAGVPMAAPERRLLMDGARSVLASPLVADGTALGILLFWSRTPGRLSSAHASTFARAAAQVSVVVHKTRAYGEGLQGVRALANETRRLRQEAATDALTGVLNRRALDERLDAAWTRYAQDGAGFGLVFWYLDHFKQVNDTYGHGIGDRVLADAATQLARGLRGGDAFGRYGGEEFLAIIDTSVDDTLSLVAQRLRTMLQKVTHGGRPVTASFGVASCRRFTSLEDLVSSADRALYEAKHKGRNCCVAAASRSEFVPLEDVVR